MEEDFKSKIKLCLVKILKSNILESHDIEGIKETELHEDINEIETDDLILYTIPFILGVFKNSKEDLMNFIENLNETVIFHNEKDASDHGDIFSCLTDSNGSDISSSNIINSKDDKKAIPQNKEENDILSQSSNSFETIPSMNSLIKNFNKNAFNSTKVISDIKKGILNREDKIFMYNKIKEFKFDFIDWEDREYITELLRICFYKSLILYRVLLTEESIVKKPDEKEPEEYNKPRVFKILPCGHLNPVNSIRKEFLKRKNNPTMTLDEYANKLMSKQKDSDQIVVEKKEKNENDLRKEDDENDFRRNFRGNTRNIS